MSRKNKILAILFAVTVLGVAFTILVYTGRESSSVDSDSSSSFPFFIMWIPIFTAILAGKANKENEEELKNDKWIKIGLLGAVLALGVIVLLTFYFFLR